MLKTCGLIPVMSFLATVPAASQTSQRVADAVRSQARRLAAQPVSSAVPVHGAPTDSDRDWAQIRRIAGGRDVQLTVGQRPPFVRAYLTSDSTEIVVLNLADQSLPLAAVRIVRTLAATSPDFLLHERSEYAEDRVRLDRDGLWIDSRLVVGRADLIQHISRGDVREVRFTPPGDSYWRSHLLWGLAAGAVFGYMYGSQCGHGAVRAECDSYGKMFMVLGGGAGLGIGAAVAAHGLPPTAPIYSAP